MGEKELGFAELVQGLTAELERRKSRGQERIRVRAVAVPPRPRPAEPTGSAASLSAPSAPSSQRAQPGPATSGQPETAALAAAAPDLAALKETVAECHACELCKTRKQTVFGDGRNGGTERSRVMFIGEAPGQEEDARGVPFVGRAGELLTDIIEKGMGIPREEVYIANVLKCRPPGNRDPEPLEKALCTPYLDRQIELVNPEVLIPLGLHASRHVLKSTDSMGRLRGRIQLQGGRKVIPTYHPAYLLRSPGRKKECWQDIQVAMGELQLPGRS